MRIGALIFLSLMLRGPAFAEEPKPIFEDRSLRDLLVAEQVVGYQYHADTGVFSIALLSEETKEEVRQYYKDGSHLKNYNRLERAYNDMRSELQRERDRQTAEQLVKLQRELSELRRPTDIEIGTGLEAAASVIRCGTDYLVVRELHSGREVLMPLQRIAKVTDDTKR